MKRKYFTFKPFIDVLFCCLLMLVAILFLLKTQEQKTKMRPPNVLYEVILTWDGKSGDDLDLWVQSASGHLVGFNRREGGHGSLVSLDHDALGVRNNSLGEAVKGKIVEFHVEKVSFRGVVEGENIVNVHVYSKRDEGPVKCTVTLVKIKPFKEVIKKETVFAEVGEEKTIFRFVTDAEANVVGTNELQTKLVNSIQ